MEGQVADIAARLAADAAAVCATIRSTLEEHIPELRGDSRTRSMLDASVHGTVDTLLHAWRHEIAADRVTAPAASVEHARRLAQHDVPVGALMRAYRLGQRVLTERIFAELRAMQLNSATRVAVIESVTPLLFAYIDRVSQEIVTVYEAEREHRLEGPGRVRALRVRELLSGSSPLDAEAASAAIGYPLRLHHVGLIVWFPRTAAGGDDTSRLQRFVRELSAAAGTDTDALFTPDDPGSGWAWLPYRSAPTGIARRIREFAGTRTDTPGIAIGAPGAGVDGFRRSHRQAMQARGVAPAVAGGHPTVVSVDDPGLMAAALLGGDLGTTRTWVCDVLGRLAADTPGDDRLRETLRVFLGAGSSYKAAAQELGLHFNTVKYRVRRALDRRGRPIEADRLDVEIALLACRWFGSAVLE
ncbi:PucR family transcriptional regulator [Nocardia stercoris]|uniref:PucR family transcriptional regulator n=1 Tax=Nocardia stercoris TaxID=2483361 RepID=UPI001F201E99|nr:helix-turn-helix domain-containing protein [Nocardia stercoris]